MKKKVGKAMLGAGGAALLVRAYALRAFALEWGQIIPEPLRQYWSDLTQGSWWDILLRLLPVVLAVLLIVAASLFIRLQVRVMGPVKKLKAVTDRLGEMEPEELTAAVEKLPGDPGDSARAMAAYVNSVRSAAREEMAEAQITVEDYKLRTADAIAQSLLPQKLREGTDSRNYDLLGAISPGIRRNCSFYDYFYVGENTLCFAVGQVPGFGIAEALVGVVAQTAIRSQLRMGRSLIETMNDVNTLLYGFGEGRTVSALVGVINTMSGQLSYVNAGCPMPFIMRSEERFERLQTPVYTPLAANENVVYRSEKLRINQGDRLFLYTSDLGEMTNREGNRFQDKEFQAALNRSRAKAVTVEELISFVEDEAAAFCESGNDVLSSAVIALEYKKGNKDYIFTIVRGTRESAPIVTEFLRKTLEEGGISPRDRARHILLGEELFSLCCRSCQPDSDVKVELAILTEENTVHLRLTAPMGGRDPLLSGEDIAGGGAANYIRSHAKQVRFEAGNSRDLVELVSELGSGTPA